MLLQIPLLIAVFPVVRHLGAGLPVGAIGAVLVASATSAPLFGVRGATLGVTLGQAGWSPAGALVLATGLATALVTYATSRHLVLTNVSTVGLEGPAGTVQHHMPTLSALGLLASTTVLPLGVLTYWLFGALWTSAQQAAVNRWAPTPGSAAHARHEARHR